MKWHPATLMLAAWALCATLFVLLPFRIINRDISVYGFIVLFLFIAAFCVGAWFKTPKITQRRAPVIDFPHFKTADRVIAIVAVIAIAALLLDLRNGAGGDLSAAWHVRDERAGAILNGLASGSSLAFQIGFLTAPIGYVCIAKEVIFYPRIRFFRVMAFGFGPLVASSLALGGRGPLLFALTMFGLSYLVRRFVTTNPALRTKRRLTVRKVALGAVVTVVVLASLNYFVEVFNVRAASAGGGAAMLEIVGNSWGVMFDGPVEQAMISIIGEGNTYLVFVFAWYLTQGMIISNVLFTSYAGTPMLGLYGIELAIAIGRRINPEFVSNSYAKLDDLNAYGFVSSAFGTLYVDYWFIGVLIAAIWGYLAALVYQKARTSSDGRWLIAVPFVVQGILFSLINTPLGLSNGTVTHFWMIAICLISKPRVSKSPQAGVIEPPMRGEPRFARMRAAV